MVGALSAVGGDGECALGFTDAQVGGTVRRVWIVTVIDWMLTLSPRRLPTCMTVAT